MNYVYVVLRRDREPDELAIIKAWTKREEAEAARKRLLETASCLPKDVKVQCISCS